MAKPLGEDEIRATNDVTAGPRTLSSWFHGVPEISRPTWTAGGKLRGYWMNLFAAYEKEFPSWQPKSRDSTP